jgi:hypothetical protein
MMELRFGIVARTLAAALFSRDEVLPPAIDVERASWGWLPQLALTSALAVVATALSAIANRRGHDWGLAAFYVSMAAFLGPIAARVAWSGVSRCERIGLVLLATVALYIVRIIREPIYFVDHDEFLHWVTSTDIIEEGRLFTPNLLLPISPHYPGLEIVTTALVNLTGMSIFGAALLILFIARVVFMATLFLIYERMAGSSRAAGLACIVYMGCTNFVFFDASFSYESLALTFLALSLGVAILLREGHAFVLYCVLPLPFLAALALTHHMTSYIAGFLFSGFAILEIVRRASVTDFSRAVVLASIAVSLPLAWGKLMGDPGDDYLEAIFADLMYGLRQLLHFFSGDRQLFVAEDGTMTPNWQRYATLFSILLACTALATCFFRALARAGIPIALEQFSPRLSSFFGWRDSWLVLFTFVTLAYPISLVLRVSGSGWGVGNRISAFAYLGVSIVIAIGIDRFLAVGAENRWRALLFGGCATICVWGGVVSGTGQLVLVGPNYRVAADAASIEPMGISAAVWTKDRLGPGNRFIGDRINRLLLSTYGRQDVVDPQHSAPLLSNNVGWAEIASIRRGDVDFILVDLRLATQLPFLGHYIDSGLDVDSNYQEPVSLSALMKFKDVLGVGRPFDNGFISIIDVRKLRND